MDVAITAMPVAEDASQPAPDRVLIGDTPEVRAWVRAAQAGDRAAFDALVSTHYRAVYRTAMAALQRAEDADDATQDAFVLAWRKIAAFRGDSSFKTWLLTIVWRQALDRRRSRDRWWRRRETTVATSDQAWTDSTIWRRPTPIPPGWPKAAPAWPRYSRRSRR